MGQDAKTIEKIPVDLDLAFKALASETRREILRILGESHGDAQGCCTSREVCACELSERLGLAASTISHHMRQLMDAGLVTSRKKGQWVHYALQRDALARAARELESL
ncbi:MAG: metalloregulator ArsR/SmtB family transcription factor [Actinomycetota bacterium]|jgi:ArsR family transcriptional regulator|nr:metalloregulator ArsR/SmtB family transcription factor [Actinomycetota bacterium]